MSGTRESLRPIEGAARPDRRRLGLKDELLLALLPTVPVLAVLGLVEALSRQRLLFALLASSAFLIYLDPKHATNAVRTLVAAQLSAAGLGLAGFVLLGPGYLSAGLAMVRTETKSKGGASPGGTQKTGGATAAEEADSDDCLLGISS